MKEASQLYFAKRVGRKMKAKPVKTIDSEGNEVVYPSVSALCRKLNISVTTADKYMKNGNKLRVGNSILGIVSAEDSQK